jgi:hypothetical protein
MIKSTHAMRAVLAGVCVAAVAGPASAHRLEPINTEYAQPFEPGVGVLKLGYGYQMFGPTRDNSLDAELEIGLVKRLQLSAGQGYLWRNGQGRQKSGLTNLETSLRYLVAGGAEKGYAVSLNPGYTFASGGRRVREGIPSYGLAVNADYFRIPGWMLFSNLGYEQASRGEGGEDRERRVFYRLAAVHPISRQWNPTVELAGDHDVATGRHDLTLIPEIQYFKSARVEFKLAVPIKLDHGAGRFGVQLQATYALGKGSHG